MSLASFDVPIDTAMQIVHSGEVEWFLKEWNRIQNNKRIRDNVNTASLIRVAVSSLHAKDNKYFSKWVKDQEKGVQSREQVHKELTLFEKHRLEQKEKLKGMNIFERRRLARMRKK